MVHGGEIYLLYIAFFIFQFNEEEEGITNIYTVWVLPLCYQLGFGCSKKMSNEDEDEEGKKIKRREKVTKYKKNSQK